MKSILFFIIILLFQFISISQNNKDGQCISGDCENGYGNYTYKSGKNCIGNWIDGKMNGYGTCIWSDGDKYDGNFIDDKKSGYGIYKFPNNYIWEGNWDNNKFVSGKKILSDGTVIEEGLFDNDKLIKTKEQLEDERITQEKWLNRWAPIQDQEKSKVEDLQKLSKENSQEINSVACDIIFSRPNLKFNYIDNRKPCCFCQERSAKYTNTGEFEKCVEEVEYLTETLYLHHKKIGANDEHVKTDLKSLENFITITYLKKNPLYMGLLFLPKIQGVTTTLSNVLGEIFGLSDDLGEKLGKTTRDIDLYKVEKFCRPKCADDCSKMYKCPCN